MRTKFENHYKTLHIRQNATQREIKEAFHKLIKTWHPDKNLNDTKQGLEFCKRINRAYAVLSDPARRRAYDIMYSKTPNDNRDQRNGQSKPRPTSCRNWNGGNYQKYQNDRNLFLVFESVLIIALKCVFIIILNVLRLIFTFLPPLALLLTKILVLILPTLVNIALHILIRLTVCIFWSLHIID